MKKAYYDISNVFGLDSNGTFTITELLKAGYHIGYDIGQNEEGEIFFYMEGDDTSSLSLYIEFLALDDTELKDINDKPIYADSSIVEFNYTSGKKQWGYFKYNNERASYDLISGDTTLNYSYNFRQINNIKIIDTIQENKLGLIK